MLALGTSQGPALRKWGTSGVGVKDLEVSNGYLVTYQNDKGNGSFSDIKSIGVGPVFLCFLWRHCSLLHTKVE